jgi:hypothetical protein
MADRLRVCQGGAAKLVDFELGGGTRHRARSLNGPYAGGQEALERLAGAYLWFRLWCFRRPPHLLRVP